MNPKIVVALIGLVGHAVAVAIRQNRKIKKLK